jgi:hypothetical protein
MKRVTILLAVGGVIYSGVIVYLMSILDSLNPFEWVVLMCTMFLSLGAVAYGCNRLDEQLNNK